MPADTKLENLAEHFGCATFFRRMLATEAALLEVGDAVKVWWEREEKLFSGRIGKKNMDDTFQIFYDDDRESAHTDNGFAVVIRLLDSPWTHVDRG